MVAQALKLVEEAEAEWEKGLALACGGVGADMLKPAPGPHMAHCHTVHLFPSAH